MGYKFIDQAGTYTLTHRKTKLEEGRERYWGVTFDVAGHPDTLYYEKVWKTNPRDNTPEDAERVRKYNEEQRGKIDFWERNSPIVADVIIEVNGQFRNAKIKDYHIVGEVIPETESAEEEIPIPTDDYLNSIKNPDDMPF